MLNEYEPLEKISRQQQTCTSPTLLPINSTMRWLEESYFFRMQQVHMNDEMQLQGGIILNAAAQAELPFATSFFTLSGNSTAATVNQNSDQEASFSEQFIQSNPTLVYRQQQSLSPSNAIFQEFSLPNFLSGPSDDRTKEIKVDNFLKSRQRNLRQHACNQVKKLQDNGYNSVLISSDKPYNKINSSIKQLKEQAASGFKTKLLVHPNETNTGIYRDESNARFSDYKYMKRRQAPTLATGRKSKDDQLPPEEEEKRRLRRERNKVAAAKCRQRRADLTKKLEMESDSLMLNIQRLKQEILQLSTERNKLRMTICAHRNSCPALMEKLRSNHRFAIVDEKEWTI